MPQTKFWSITRADHHFFYKGADVSNHGTKRVVADSPIIVKILVPFDSQEKIVWDEENNQLLLTEPLFTEAVEETLKLWPSHIGRGSGWDLQPILENMAIRVDKGLERSSKLRLNIKLSQETGVRQKSYITFQGGMFEVVFDVRILIWALASDLRDNSRLIWVSQDSEIGKTIPEKIEECKKALKH